MGCFRRRKKGKNKQNPVQEFSNLNNNKRSFIIKGIKFIIGFLLPMWKSMHYSQEMIKFMKYTENNVEKFDYDVSTDSDSE